MKKAFNILNGGYSSDNPIFLKGQRNKLQAEDGEWYIDMAMGAGSLIFGHGEKDIVDAISSQAQHSSILLQNNTIIQDFSQKIATFVPSYLNKFVFCNTGSEATQRAVRLARAATGKTHIASFQGGWHGMNEWTLLDDGGRFGETKIKSYAGIPQVALNHSVLLPYNCDLVWQLLEENAGKLAAIIIEPIQGSNPQSNIRLYLEKLIAYCKSLEILVIFDEVITGFRLAQGGASEDFRLKADIVTYGKILGGGLPIGMVACSERVFQKTFAVPSKSILTGGTFSANPLTAAAGLATLKKLNDDLYLKLNALGEHFRQELNNGFKLHGIPFKADGYKSINRVYFTDQSIRNRAERDKLELPAEKQNQFRKSLYEQKVIWPTNGVICLSSSLDIVTLDEVIEKVIIAAKNTLVSK
jgi:glutamate-1-semialdehyde 2,1-aminomutase